MIYLMISKSRTTKLEFLRGVDLTHVSGCCRSHAWPNLTIHIYLLYSFSACG